MFFAQILQQTYSFDCTIQAAIMFFNRLQVYAHSIVHDADAQGVCHMEFEYN